MKFLVLIIILVSNTLFSFPVESISREYSAKQVYEVLSQWQELSELVQTGIIIQDSIVINDSLTAPFAYYIPSGYETTSPIPLFVYLHGGVGVPEFYPMDDIGKNNDFVDFAEKHKMLLLLPRANIHCMWWDETGAENILNLIRLMKDRYNVDDDRVYVSGISDGGSGSYHLAMTRPNVFASFYPIIGMMSVGNLENGRHTYPANLTNRFTAAVNNDNDGLYPAAKMRKTIDMAQTAGADLFYKEFWGFGHEVPYLSTYLETIHKQMQQHPRDPFQPQLYWEVSEMEFNRCDWIEVTQIDTLRPKQNWHKDYNVKLTDDRMIFGFNSDTEYKGNGTLITRVVENSAAFNAGLQVNDLIIRMDGKTATNLDSLITWRDAKSRGDEFTLTVLRDGKEMQLDGQFPEPTEYDAFQLIKPSAAVKARYFGNHFTIETSRVKEIAVYLHPEMINYEIPIVITINGKTVLAEIMKMDREFMLRNFEKYYDRKAVWTNRIVLEVP